MMDAYNCHKCHTRHTVGNMVAVCAACVHKIETEFRAEVLSLREKLSEAEEDIVMLRRQCHQEAVDGVNVGFKAAESRCAALEKKLSECLCWKSEHCPLHSVGIAEAESRALAQKLRADGLEFTAIQYRIQCEENGKLKARLSAYTAPVDGPELVTPETCKCLGEEHSRYCPQYLVLRVHRAENELRQTRAALVDLKTRHNSLQRLKDATYADFLLCGKERDLALSRLAGAKGKVADLSKDFLTVIELLDRNTKPGQPQDPDTGECYFCEKGVFTNDEWDSEDGYDKLSVPRFHKTDCAWRQAREMLDPAKNAEALAAHDAQTGEGA